MGVRPVNARAARSASTVSAKSCFAAVATTKGKGMLLEYHDSSDNAKNRGIAFHFYKNCLLRVVVSRYMIE